MEAEDKKIIKMWKRLKILLDSEIIQLIISIACGLAIGKILKDMSWSADFVEAGLGGVISYIVIHTIKNPSGKLSEALENNKAIMQESNEALSALNSSLNHDDISKQPIAILLKHLADESFGKCSNSNRSCVACNRYKLASDGLLRTYLREDCENLVESIENVNNEKKYKLDNNIPFYHTLAIDQLKLMEGEHYRVIQTLLSGDEIMYDDMDIDFLKKFIEEIFEKEYEKADKFQVQWIFVGEHSKDKAKNNYKYLVDELSEKSVEIKSAFLFKTISQEAYKRIKNQNPKKRNIKIDEYYKNEPSLGIFGDGFTFVDASPNEDQHGTMYSDSNQVSGLLEFYKILWESTESKENDFEELANYCN